MCSARAAAAAPFVDNPMAVPRRMASLGIGGSIARGTSGASLGHTVSASFTYGLTGRLELVDLLGLRYAFLDDAPAATSSTGKTASSSFRS